MPSPTLDAIDRRILEVLQTDASITNVELARRGALSPSPCLARVKALEAAGVIRGYVALADPLALGPELERVHSGQPRWKNRSKRNWNASSKRWPRIPK